MNLAAPCTVQVLFNALAVNVDIEVSACAVATGCTPAWTSNPSASMHGHT
jgi:hypothetical protein